MRAVALDEVFSPRDAARAYRVLERLAGHGLRCFHLTGSLALGTHRVAAGHHTASRILNDLDIVVPSFACVPDTLAGGFLVRHIHPKAPKGRIVVQLVDAEDALRNDVFSSRGGILARSQLYDSPAGKIPVISLEDLTARIASLVVDLECGHKVARKHAETFQWLAEFADPERVENVWQDHRRTSDPASFQEVRERILNLVHSHPELLVTPEYSHNADAICLRCEEAGAWRLASGRAVMSILGYV
jgi:hypothetical protein